jgi:hypothetical protein
MYKGFPNESYYSFRRFLSSKYLFPAALLGGLFLGVVGSAVLRPEEVPDRQNISNPTDSAPIFIYPTAQNPGLIQTSLCSINLFKSPDKAGWLKVSTRNGITSWMNPYKTALILRTVVSQSAQDGIKTSSTYLSVNKGYIAPVGKFSNTVSDYRVLAQNCSQEAIERWAKVFNDPSQREMYEPELEQDVDAFLQRMKESLEDFPVK